MARQAHEYTIEHLEKPEGGALESQVRDMESQVREMLKLIPSKVMKNMKSFRVTVLA